MQLYGHWIDPLVLFIGTTILLILIAFFVYKRKADSNLSRFISIVEFGISIVIWQVLDMFLFLSIFTFTSGTEDELYMRYYIGRIALFLGIFTAIVLIERYRGVSKIESEKTEFNNEIEA